LICNWEIGYKMKDESNLGEVNWTGYNLE